MRHWTQEERIRQSELIRNWMPWKLAGVKTVRGKEISKMNAYVHGRYSAKTITTIQFIAECRRTLNKIKSYLADDTKK